MLDRYRTEDWLSPRVKQACNFIIVLRSVCLMTRSKVCQYWCRKRSIELTVSSFHYRKFYNSIWSHFETVNCIFQDSGLSEEKARGPIFIEEEICCVSTDKNFFRNATRSLIATFHPLNLSFYIFSQLYTPLSRATVIPFLAFLPRFPHFHKLFLSLPTFLFIARFSCFHNSL